MKYILALDASHDFASIAAWTEQEFGPQTDKRYIALIETAIDDVAADPELPGSATRTVIGEHCRTYHLQCSRKRAAKVGARVRRPRHFLLYRAIYAETVEIGRILHESVDLEKHLPDEYRPSSG